MNLEVFVIEAVAWNLATQMSHYCRMILYAEELSAMYTKLFTFIFHHYSPLARRKGVGFVKGNHL